MEKDYPILYTKADDCCGCTACATVCKSSAISMREDKEGFFYPEIDTALCVKCYMCVKICPLK